MWGAFCLARPDPQIIWNTPKGPVWKKAQAHYRRSSTGGGSWEFYQKFPESWEISYRDLRFRIRPTGFKHTGLFPEQAVNWDLFRQLIQEAGRPVSVLNLFAYTGGATLACAAGGASVCHVDASKEWLPGRGKMRHCQDWQKSRSAGSWTTVKSLWRVRSDAAENTMRSLWTHPPMGGAVRRGLAAGGKNIRSGAAVYRGAE